VSAGVEKFPQSRRGQRDGVGPNDADDFKAGRQRRGGQFRFQRGVI